MSLLAADELFQLIDDGVIGADPRHVNSASIDVRLGNEFYLETRTDPFRTIIDPSDRSAPHLYKYVVADGETFDLEPNAFALAHTVETFNLPNDVSALFLLRSTMARHGLDHAHAAFADAGWHNSCLTLELHNNLQRHTIRLTPGMRIGQMLFFRHALVPTTLSYASRGSYNHSLSVVTGRGAQV